MPNKQPENRGDSREIQANREGKTKSLDVLRASSQRPPDSKGKSIASHLSASRKETDLSLHDQSSDTQQDLGASTRDLAKRVGGASTRDLAKRVVDVNNRSNQVKKQSSESGVFEVSKKLENKRLTDIFKIGRSQGTSEVQWSSNEQGQHRRSLSNPTRDIGSKNQAASSSADWAMKAEEAIIARDASSEQIEQLMQERSDLLKDLQRKQNKLDSIKRNIEIKKIENKIKLEEIKQRNAIIRAQSFKIVSEAAQSRELRK